MKNLNLVSLFCSYDLRSDYVAYWTQTYSRLPAVRTVEEEEKEM